jgi:ATP-dependent Clp protease adaptor protein ClpS
MALYSHAAHSAHAAHTVYAAAVAPDTDTDTEDAQQTRLLPPYHVIIENDDHHTMPFVIHVLREVFKFDEPKAFQVMLHAHEEGEAICWTGSKEVAELKLDQILCFHEQKDENTDLGPLGARIEPAA